MITAAFWRSGRKTVRGLVFAVVSSVLLGTAALATSQERAIFPGAASPGDVSSHDAGSIASATVSAGFTAPVDQGRTSSGSNVLGFPPPVVSDWAVDNSASGGLSLPGAPVLSLQSITPTAITLIWPVVNNAVTYNIYRSTTPGTVGVTQIASNVKTLLFADTTVASGKTYYYHVTAVNASGESVFSNRISAALANLAPVISSLSLNTVTAGKSSFALTIHGANFNASSVVKFGNTALTPVSLASTAITVTVPAASIAAVGNVTVSVVNPAPGGGTATAPFSVTAGVTLSTFTLSRGALAGGVSVTGTVTLSGAAPIGGLPVSLLSNSAVASVLSQVKVPAGAVSAIFTITTTPVAANTAVTLSAASGGVTRVAGLTVLAPTLTSLVALSNSVIGGTVATIQARISSIAPVGGLLIPLSSNSSAISAKSITVPAGSTLGSITLPVSGVDQILPVTLLATLGSITKSAGITILPAILSQLTVPSSILGGAKIPVTVSLTGKAGPSGVTVAVVSLDLTSLSPVTLLKVPAGASSATGSITPGLELLNTLLTIIATEGGITKIGTLPIIGSLPVIGSLPL